MTNLRWVAVLVGPLLVAAAVVVLVNGYHEGRYEAKTKEAAIHAAKADALVSVARQKDVQIASRTSDLAKAQKDIDRLKAEYAKLRAGKGSSALPGVPLPAVPPGGVEPGQPSDGALGEAADAVINAQDRLIEDQAAQILDLTASRDSWKGAFEEEHKRAVALQIALDAQKHAAKSGKWIGRIQGFAVGIGIGYAGGKLR